MWHFAKLFGAGLVGIGVAGAYAGTTFQADLEKQHSAAKAIPLVGGALLVAGVAKLLKV